ncbi:hypothetical protein PINS_up002830 [Pythium insidiosum]|nr:hypothetical protein PINS_up002830 [Pythium insidiosum]
MPHQTLCHHREDDGGDSDRQLLYSSVSPSKRSDECTHLLSHFAAPGAGLTRGDRSHQTHPLQYQTSTCTAVWKTTTSNRSENGSRVVCEETVYEKSVTQTVVTTMFAGPPTSAPVLLPSQSCVSNVPNNVRSTDKRRRHSILRVGSMQSMPKCSLKKSASVEFALNHEEELRVTTKSHRVTNSIDGSSMPRRLTSEEREELYKIRPDLEIGPAPFFQEQMEELRRENRRRVTFALFGGILSMLLLLVFYYLFSLQ